jgi:hypothetical protein
MYDRMAKIVEIRSLTLRAGKRDRFHEVFVARALPLLRRERIDVIAYGPSLHDDTSYFVIRAFASLEERAQDDDDAMFAVADDILDNSTIVLRVDDEAFEAFAALVTGRPYASKLAWRRTPTAPAP